MFLVAVLGAVRIQETGCRRAESLMGQFHVPGADFESLHDEFRCEFKILEGHLQGRNVIISIESNGNNQVNWICSSYPAGVFTGNGDTLKMGHEIVLVHNDVFRFVDGTHQRGFVVAFSILESSTRQNKKILKK